mmetsp:Transcript_51280/g.104299  ORF Transcript_51280/g.104299 Transcript_51280/m.104299 type:complete len:144 (-) Transcript_51280:265-696(-)
MEWPELSFPENLENETTPLSVNEVVLFLENRNELFEDFEKFNLRMDDNKTLVYNKIYEYTKRFSQVKKTEIKKLRQTIDQIIKEEAGLNLDKLQARIVLCKIFDLFPNSMEETILLFPAFKKFFSSNTFKFLYKEFSLYKKNP